MRVYSALPAISLTFFVVVYCQLAGAQQPSWVDPKAVDLPAPKYPMDAFNAHRGGLVVVSVGLDKNGRTLPPFNVWGPNAPCSNLHDPAVVSIRKAAIAAAEKSVFLLGSIAGKPTTTIGPAITYFFDPADRNVRVGEEFALKSDTTQLKGEVLNGRALKLPKPSYPHSRQTLIGDIKVKVLISEDGHVLEAGAYYGIPSFNDAVMSAACKAEFSPTYVDGKPVKVSGMITYRFVP